MDVIDGQLSIFEEAETLSDVSDEPQIEEVVQTYKRKKQKGKCDADFEGLQEEIIPTHTVSVKELNAFYGESNQKSMPS